ncbi:MAG: DUF349 domain-containing protein, partial [Gammaproteobacteria bacterium]|nr:DUF349 domain-containing protein [Gammaproteobacteria bacterium]
MKLFQNLFKPKWKNSNPEIRKQALISLDRDTNQSVFSEVVNQDNKSELRQLAVKRINDLDELITIAAKNSDEKVRETARKITSQILAGITDITGKQAVDESTRIERINSIDSQKTLEFIAQKGDTSAIRLAAINKVSREALLGDLTINDEDPNIRKQVAEKLHQKSTLERVLKAIKNKDKQISKIVKDKLDQITAEEERPRLVLSKQKSLCLSMEQLGKKGLWERDKVQFDQLKQQWQELASENTLALLELQQRFNAAAESFQTDYDAYLERNEARLKQEAALLPLKKEKQAILEQLHQLLKHITTDRTDDEINTVDTFNQQLNSLVNNWNSIEMLPGDIEEDFTRQYQDAIKSVKSIITEIDSGNKAAVDLTSIHSEIDRLIKQGFKLKLSKINSLEKRLQSIRVDDPDLQQKKSDITALIRKAELIIEKNEARANNTFTETQNLLNELDIHLNNGEIKNANDTQKKIQSNIKLLDKIGHKSLNTLKNQSAEFTAKLFELNKWRSWANTPQKERLITEMEALIDSDMDAKEIAFLVSKARKEWQQLGPSDRNSSQELWERFNKACDTAYEPCKAVFEDEANIRNENYNARIAFLNNLEAFVKNANWEDVDWVKVENLYQQSRIEWQNLGPVDKNKRNAVNSRFNKAHNTLK